MKGISTYIQLKNLRFNFSESFSVQSSWDSFTDIATIVMPNNVFKTITGNNNTSIGLNSLIKRGDPVEIRAGYNVEYEQAPIIFKGFISNVGTGFLITISCQDAMYGLKQINLKNATLKNVTLQGLLDHILQDASNININLSNRISGSTGLGDWAISNNNFLSPVDVLKKLKNQYGFVSFFRDNVLNVGLPYDNTGTTHYLLKELQFIEDDLVNQVNDVRKVLKGISIKPDNSKIVRYAVKENEVITVGSEVVQGETRTLNYYNLTEIELDNILKNIYENTNFSGLQGNFSTFGEPAIRHNDYVKFRDLKNEERSGTYKVRSVNTSMSVSSGLRQNVTLDFGISEINKN